jgi:hypothetical protein
LAFPFFHCFCFEVTFDHTFDIAIDS